MSAEPQGTHFWFMVIQTPNRQGVHLGSYQGVRTPGRGETRFDLFNAIRIEVCEECPDSRGGAVIAFDIQPNKI